MKAEGDLDIDAELLAAIAASEAADRDAGASAHVVRDGMAQFEAVVGVGGRVAEYIFPPHPPPPFKNDFLKTDNDMSLSPALVF